MFWDIHGEQGHPVRTTISELGPMLLGRLLELNEVQEGVLNIVFQVADENGWLLLDLKDLRALLDPRLGGGGDPARPATATSPRRASGPSCGAC